MKAWSIFRHSVRQVFGNLDAAIRISLALFAVQVVVGLALGLALSSQAGGAGSSGPAGVAAMQVLFSGRAMLAGIVAVAAYLWVAVAWHRYVLENEISPGWMPVFEGMRMLGYLGTTVLIVAVLVAVELVLSSLLFFLHAVLPQLGVLEMILSYYPMLVVLALLGPSLRLLCVLPGVALEPGHRLLEGWRATRGTTGTFYALEAIMLVGIAALRGLSELAFTLLGPMGLIVSIPLQWVEMMVGISILTTLYGHYIQQRPLI